MRNLLPFQGWRLTMFQAVMFATFLIFSLRMYQMQVIDFANAQIAADDNRLDELPLPSERGVMFDRYDRTVAGNVPAYIIQVTPAELPTGREETLNIYNRLSAMTGVPPTRAVAEAGNSDLRSIEEMVQEGAGIAPFRPVPVAQDVPLEVAMRIMEENYDLPGVSVEEAAVRLYPSGALTAHVVGYMGRIPPEEELELIERGYNPAFDRIGYAGVERYFEDVLAGQRGSVLREVDVAGQPINQVAVRAPEPGENLRLTLDTELQEAAERALLDRIARINAEAGRIVTDAGVVIAMDPMTGEILAMVSHPSYDNSRFARAIDVEYYLDLLENERNPLFNQSISALYSPGSAWKLITAAAVIEEDIINPNTRLFDGGDILVQNFYAPNDRAADQRFVCWDRNGHGFVDLVTAIAQSCNVYFYQVGGGNPELSEATLRSGGLGINNLVRHANALGINSPTFVELPGEAIGRMPDPDWKRVVHGENWSTGDTYNAAFGQGYVNVTPLQLINSVAALVNNGTLYKPTVVRDYLDAEGNITQAFEPTVLRTVNPAQLAPDEPLTLLLLEDMIIQGRNSLACTCEPTSADYNPNRCNPQDYRAMVDVAEGFAEDMREYTVYTPPNYQFTDNICDPRRFDPNYTPAFLGDESLELVRQGMRATVTIGTAEAADLPYITVAGKTGTAEYCDNIAWALGLCVQGNWPSHAWFTAYAPYEDPEILVIAFIYNGGEGSANALPVVVETVEAYVRLRNERENQPQPADLLASTLP